jgi:hypothetical protein
MLSTVNLSLAESAINMALLRCDKPFLKTASAHHLNYYWLSTLQARSRKRVQLRMYHKFTRNKTSREEQKLRQMDILTAIPPAPAAVAGRRRRA